MIAVVSPKACVALTRVGARRAFGAVAVYTRVRVALIDVFRAVEAGVAGHAGADVAAVAIRSTAAVLTRIGRAFGHVCKSSASDTNAVVHCGYLEW